MRWTIIKETRRGAVVDSRGWTTRDTARAIAKVLSARHCVRHRAVKEEGR